MSNRRNLFLFETTTKNPFVPTCYFVLGRNRNVRLHGNDRYVPISTRHKQYNLNANEHLQTSNQKYGNMQQTKPSRYFVKRKRRNRRPEGHKYVRVGINKIMCARFQYIYIVRTTNRSHKLTFCCYYSKRLQDGHPVLEAENLRNGLKM